MEPKGYLVYKLEDGPGPYSNFTPICLFVGENAKKKADDEVSLLRKKSKMDYYYWESVVIRV